MTTLRETIRQTTAAHLDAGHMVMGQCLSAVGWVGGTLPERHDMTELPMADVAGAGFAVGAALAGRRPIYVIRYQGFGWLNLPLIVNYAAKSKALWGVPCPMLIRSIAMEGGIGPVAGSSHHALLYRMPGVRIYAPMTPGEWRAAYQEFMAGDDVVYLSEHRGAYGEEYEFIPSLIWEGRPDISIFAVSITRKAAAEASAALYAQDGPRVSVHHIWRLKPFAPSHEALNDLARSERGIVLDDDYPDGVAKAIAHDLHVATGARMHVMGLPERTAGFAPWADVLPPDAEAIKAEVRRLLA